MISFLNLAQIVMIDLSMAGDNALVVGLAVAALPPKQRRKAMAFGIAVAASLRVVFALFAVQLLHITGLLVAGGLLLLWVGWKMARELHLASRPELIEKKSVADKFSSAVWQIIIADVSMSLDNVLGVAGVARDHFVELIFGLGLSAALMGLASVKIAGLTAKYPKVGYIGVAIILYVALRMIYDGAIELSPTLIG